MVAESGRRPYHKVIRDHWFALAQGKLHPNPDLRRRRAALAQHPCRMGNGMLAQFDCHRDEAAFWILGDVSQGLAPERRPLRQASTSSGRSAPALLPELLAPDLPGGSHQAGAGETHARARDAGGQSLDPRTLINGC
jgi:hypothetical protein